MQGAVVAKKKESFTEAIKLRPTFARRLKLIAEHVGKPPGELIELQMSQWVATQYPEVARLKAKQLEADAESLEE